MGLRNSGYWAMIRTMGRGLALALCALPALVAGARAVTVPTNFVVENAVPNHAFYNPTGIAFLPDGRMLVAEKRGLLWMVANGVAANSPSLDIQSEVLDLYDRGLLDVAVDPNFLNNHYIYVLYEVDPNPSGADTSIAAYGRLARYQLDQNGNAITSSRTILLGDTWTNGPLDGNPSHAIGALRWGADGSLLVSCGDGALYTEMDPGGYYPYAFGTGRTDPYEDIGAFRAQSLSSLCGKVLRIDPATGQGYSNNPFWDGNPASKRSRIWEYGFRNPFRFTVRPGTGSATTPGSLYIGDVGWTTWEETNVAPTGGMNFGWPCYEGRYTNGPYQNASPAHNSCSSVGTTDNPSQPTLPAMAWNHTDPNTGFPPGFAGNCSVGGAFYTASNYPSAYQGRYFFADYGQNWMRVATFDANDQLVSQQPFGDSFDAPVDVVADPITGNIHYVSITTGEVRRIRYTGTGGNASPVAVATANPDVGNPPLAVQFSSSGSFDPDNNPIGFGWNFGDGTTSTAANPTHTYTNTGAYNVLLTVQDSQGAIGTAALVVDVVAPGDFPTTPVLDSFNRANGVLGANWVGDLTGLTIANNQLTQTNGAASPVWNPGVFGVTQEAYVTLNAVTGGATEHDLMLKVQGQTWDTGHIEVRYDVDAKTVTVSTYDPTQGWVHRGGPYAVTYNTGDRFGARAYPNGLVEIYKNQTLVASPSVSGWPSAGNGGRIGLTIVDATSSLLDDFGGGNSVLNSNTPPQATITSPAANSFFVAGNTINLAGSATDAQDPAIAVKLRWEVDIHHNNHIHPNVITDSSATASFPALDHDDGTGWYYVLRLIATDSGGLSDTASENIYPEIDLHPTIQVSPASLTDVTPAQVTCTIQNLGRMPAPIFHWQLTRDATTIAQGDTLMPALGSVTIVRSFAPFPGGTHVLRVAADTLNALVETNETNNGAALTIHVVDGTPPVFVTGPTVTPGSTTATVAWTTNEPATGAIRYGPTASLGESLTVALGTSQSKAITGLTRGASYSVQVAATDASGNTRLSSVMTFSTLANRPPVATASGNPTSGGAPLAVTFSSAGSSDPDGDPLTYSWNFGDGSALSTAANPSHTYTSVGSYTAQLTVSDGFGGSNSAAVPITVSTFPTTAVLDNFNRTNGSVGGSWAGQTTGLAISNNQLVQTTSGWNTIVWNGATFGADQEAFVTLAAITTTSPEHDVLLKLQGTTPTSAQIEVRYDRTANKVYVATLSGSWTTWLTINQTFNAGDQLGAHASATGVVDVFRNGTKIGSVSVASWPYATQGGRIGLTIGQATSSALDNFGGGNTVTGPDVTPPTFTTGPTVTPGLNSAQVAWTTNEPATGSVRYGVGSSFTDSVLTALGTSATATLSNLTRGTSYSYRVAATDASGNTALSATATFTTNPNHAPTAVAGGNPTSGGSPLTVAFSSAGSSDPDGDALSYSWNFGDGSAVSTAANPSHTYSTQGSYTAQLTVNDGFGGSNSASVPISVAAPDVTPPTFLTGPTATPATSTATIQWTTNEPARGAVRYGVSSALGDSVTTALSTTGNATLTGLARGTFYDYRVAVTDASGNTRVTALLTFTTLPNGAPTAAIAANPASGPAPLAVAFSSAGSSDPDGDPLTYSWNFGDGSALSTAANPSHTYTSAGTYTAQLTVTDGFGGSNSKSTTITVSGVYFPVTAVLDNFNRVDGSLGSSWVSTTTSGTAIVSQQLAATNASGASPVWDGAIYGTSQEAYVTLSTIPSTSTEIDLMLKLQGTIWSAGHIEVRYDNTLHHILVSTYAPSQGWKSYGSAINVTMAAGDQLGARAYPNGSVEVLRNGARLKVYSVSAWPYYAQTGRIGITVAGSTSTRLDNFGGGTIPANHAPVAAASGTPTSGPAPLAVAFSSAGTSDADGNPLTYAWTFGDGGTSTAANPSHTYTTTGSFSAKLTVSDGLGGSSSATVPITTGSAVTFSDSPVLDDFGRADGAIGGSWTGDVGDVAIASSALVLTAPSASIVWGGATYGPTQEAFLRLTAIGADVSERDLMLDVQGPTWDTGHVEVRYSPGQSDVFISTYTPGAGWTLYGSVPATLAAGDELGGSIDAAGLVSVYQNQALLGTVSVAGWSLLGGGGRIGLTIAGGASSPVDDFGGGAEGQLSLQARPEPIEAVPVAAQLALSGAYPNPARGVVSWALSLPAAATVRWEVLDLQGRRIAQETRSFGAGVRPLVWHPGANARAGVYLAVAHVGAETFTRRFVLLSR